MAKISAMRRGHGEDAIYFAADKNRYIGAVSLGFGPDGKRLRRRVSGKTKQEVRDKLWALYAELGVGLQSSAGYTVRAAVEDWLEHGLSGRSARTIRLYRDGVRPLTDRLGARPLRKLSAADVRSALLAPSEQLSTWSLQIAHNCLVGAIRHAEALSVEQAQQLLRAAADERPGGDPHPLYAYVVLLLTIGLRPEEARAVRWDHVDLDAGTVAVWRSDRAGGDTKTPEVPAHPAPSPDCRRRPPPVQDGPSRPPSKGWRNVARHRPGLHDDDRHHARPAQHQACLPPDHKGSGLGEGWVPMEPRHTFVSIMSAGGVLDDRREL